MFAVRKNIFNFVNAKKWQSCPYNLQGAFGKGMDFRKNSYNFKR